MRLCIWCSGLQGPFLPLRELGRPRRHVEQAGAAKSGLGAELAVEIAPDLQAFHRERQLTQIAMLLATPAPVPAALLAGNVALVEHGDGMSLFSPGNRPPRSPPCQHR
jgi:hypothetical protein